MELIIRGQTVFIDECDYDLFSLGYRGIDSWNYNKDGYLNATIGRKTVRFHRLVAARMGLNIKNDVDHINKIRTDNRRINLRAATRQQNLSNQSLKTTNTSKYKGVSWSKDRNKWEAKITVNYKGIYLGRYVIKEDAARAYNEAALVYFGEFAALNVIEG